ncbi:hypothetical protein EDB84DRAFT_1565242 [Lactarius hengduanensis]|nr:hypothetical protein EDB84DRAFT_1565242 [Lactarius hengduanensis]
MFPPIVPSYIQHTPPVHEGTPGDQSVLRVVPTHPIPGPVHSGSQQGSRPKPRPIFQNPHGQQKRAQEPEPQDTLTDEELSKPLGEIIADKAKKARQSKVKTNTSTGRQKRTATQAMLEDEPRPKTSGPSTHKGGLAGRKAFTIAELVLLNQCVDEVGFEGGDLWIKVAEKFDQERHAEWPERAINSLKKKFMEMVNSKPRTGDTAIPNHVKQAKDIYMTKLGNLGAYTCCDNIRPRLSIAPPPTEDPLAETGASDHEDEDTNGLDHSNADSPTPVLLASGPSRHSKGSKEAPKRQRQQQSQSSQSRSDQREMINDFFSGRTREERDRIKFQQQTELTSLAHEYESGRMKDQRISELSEKLDKKRDELHEARLKILGLQQALHLRDLSTKDPKVLENLAHASNHLGLPLSHIHLSHIHQDFTFHQEIPRLKREYLPGVATTHEVIEILDSDDDEVTGPRPGTDDLLPQWADSTGALSKLYLDPQPTNTLALFEDWRRGVKAGGGKEKENEDPGQVGGQLDVPCFPDVRTMVPFPLAQMLPTQLPPIRKLVSEMPEAGPSTPQNMWAPVPVLHVPATAKPTTRLPGMDQLLQGPPGLHQPLIIIIIKPPVLRLAYIALPLLISHTFFLSNSNVTRSSFTSWSSPVVDKLESTVVKSNLSAQLSNLSLASTQTGESCSGSASASTPSPLTSKSTGPGALRIAYLTVQISHHSPISAYVAACPAWHITPSGIDQISVCVLPSPSLRVSSGMMNKGLFLSLDSGPGAGKHHQITHPVARINDVLHGSFLCHCA